MTAILAARIHAAMLFDADRNAKLAKAISECVHPGDTVIDLGAGTGLLSMIAARAGARKVYAIEMTRFAGVAERLVQMNGLQKIVKVVHAKSFDFAPPEQADVLLCETLGIAGFDEGLRRTLCDARDRMLRQDGRILPKAVTLVAVPVEFASPFSGVAVSDTIHGFDFSPVADLTRRLYQRAHIEESSEIADRQSLCSEDCARMAPTRVRAIRARYVVRRPAAFTGYALWFEAALSELTKLSSRSPSATNHWGQVFLPSPETTRVMKGDELLLDLRLDDTASLFGLTWSTSHQRNERGSEMPRAHANI